MNAILLVAALVAQADGASFEELEKNAYPVSDLGMLVAPFSDECAAGRRDLDRTRCLGVRAYLKDQLPQRTFITKVPGEEALTVTDYDARLRGVRVVVAGCLACGAPVETAAPGKAKRFVTLKAPRAGARSLRDGVSLAETTVTFQDVAASAAWMKETKPLLRAEFVFAPGETAWTLGASRGFAFRPLGVRVVNRCTGEVVFSQPPSAGNAAADQEGCAGVSRPVAEEKTGEGEAAAPGQLDSMTINRAMQAMRAEADACSTRFPMQGTAYLSFVVGGENGLPIRVTVEGTLKGTALAQCLTDAALRVRFPTFRTEKQEFTYPVVLTRK